MISSFYKREREITRYADSLAMGDKLDQLVAAVVPSGELSEYSSNDAAALRALNSLKDAEGTPIWWVAQRLPGRPEPERFACYCEGSGVHIHAPSLSLAICRAIAVRIKFSGDK